jgi:hypothetical protein
MGFRPLSAERDVGTVGTEWKSRRSDESFFIRQGAVALVLVGCCPRQFWMAPHQGVLLDRSGEAVTGGITTG